MASTYRAILCVVALLLVQATISAATSLRYSSSRDGKEERRYGKEESMDGKEEIMDGKEEIRAGEEESKDADTDTAGDLSSLMKRRRMELMNLQMLVASAWVEHDSLGESNSTRDSNPEKWWIGDDEESDGKNKPRMHQYREFERGATAQLGGDKSNDFWSLGMKEFLQSWKAVATPAKGDSQRHIVARRKIGALMLLEENSERQSWVEDQISKYAMLYMEELSGRNAVMLSHISKSGGTDLAECGMDAGCAAPTPEMTAHAKSISLGHKLTTKTTSFSEDCEAASFYNKQSHVTLVVSESHLSDAGLCPQFWNVIVLRDPIDRIISQLNYLHQHVVSKEWSPEYINPEWLFNEIPILTNNFFIRTLIGSKGYELPYGHINKDHLEEAKLALEKYDTVLMKTSTLKEDLYSYLGWDCDHAPEASGKTEDYAKKLTDEWSPKHWQAMKDANFLDFQLIQHARMLERLDKKVYHHPMFAYYAHSLQYRDCLSNEGNEAKCGYLCK